jgi:hypothetical protein
MPKTKITSPVQVRIEEIDVNPGDLLVLDWQDELFVGGRRTELSRQKAVNAWTMWSARGLVDFHDMDVWGKISEPLRAEHDDQALLELLSQIGGRMPIDGGPDA